MIDRGRPKLSVSRQCKLVGVSRSSLYYRPVGASLEDLDIMAKMDRQYLKTPFYCPTNGVHLSTSNLLANSATVRSPLIAARATLALKAGLCFIRFCFMFLLLYFLHFRSGTLS